jgi:16S rRNA G966 N2-methylase RsmD
MYKQQQEQQEQQEQQDAENLFLDPPFSRIKNIYSLLTRKLSDPSNGLFRFSNNALASPLR